jgi:hypothetical protein
LGRGGVALRTQPRNRTDRNHPLKGSLAAKDVDGHQLERWQHEVTGAARIFFLIDDQKRTIWFEEVHIGQPKKTER